VTFTFHEGSNSLGLAALIVSLVATFSSGLLGPIGLILSAFGMRRRPRGLAVAGVLIGLAGSLWAAFARLALAAPILALGPIRQADRRSRA